MTDEKIPPISARHGMCTLTKNISICFIDHHVTPLRDCLIILLCDGSRCAIQHEFATSVAENRLCAST